MINSTMKKSRNVFGIIKIIVKKKKIGTSLLERFPQKSLRNLWRRCLWITSLRSSSFSKTMAGLRYQLSEVKKARNKLAEGLPHLVKTNSNKTERGFQTARRQNRSRVSVQSFHQKYSHQMKMQTLIDKQTDNLETSTETNINK